MSAEDSPSTACPQLPVELWHLVLENLTTVEAWPLRSVCRAWATCVARRSTFDVSTPHHARFDDATLEYMAPLALAHARRVALEHCSHLTSTTLSLSHGAGAWCCWVRYRRGYRPSLVLLQV